MYIVHKRPCACRSQRGFSLIELVIAMGLAGIVLSTAGTMLIQAYTGERAYREQNEAQANARLAVDLITDDLRSMRPLGSLASVNFNLAHTFSLNLNDSIISPNKLKIVTYGLQGSNLRRTVKFSSGETVTKTVAYNITAGAGTKVYGARYFTVMVTATVNSAPKYRTEAEISTAKAQSVVVMRNF